MKVLLFLPAGFEHMESSVFIDVMGWARHEFSYDIDVVTAGLSRIVQSTFAVSVMVDKLIDELDADDFAALALPGGFEDWRYLEQAYDERFLALIRAFHAQQKPIASVCMGAMPLGKSGILAGRRATTYHLCNSPRLAELRKFGADTLEERIVVDGNIITSCGPETAVWVAFKLLEILRSPSDMDKVKSAMGY